MSHFRQRKEKNCLNCGTTVIGMYCHNCGQENIEPEESFWHLITHFFEDITHFDGNFFTTLRVLLFRPGFLTREYINGRRSSYLNPIRMYLFTSFIFFLVFFSIYKITEKEISLSPNIENTERIEKMSQKEFDEYTSTLNKGEPMTREKYKNYIDSVNRTGGIHFSNYIYKNKMEYDSLLANGIKKDNWIKRKLTYKEIAINEKYGKDPKKFSNVFLEILMHSFPQMLFVSLPFAAFFLKLLYFRNKKFYYVSHAIFAIHLYIFLFIVMLIMAGVDELQDYTHWSKVGSINVLLTVTIFFYLYKAMRNFYQQRRAKTILKYFLFLFSFFLLILFLLVVVVFASIFQV